MITLRKAKERGHFDHGWLDTNHSFSFASYYDPRHMGFRALRVINEDFVAGGNGFPTHPHRDMEIISYVLEGGLEHKDSMGNGSVITPGEVQRMTAGTGVTHSEYNHSEDDKVHFMQIWLLPQKNNLQPGYEQKMFDQAEKSANLRLVASPEGRDGSVVIHTDANLYATTLNNGQEVTLPLKTERYAWVQVARGSILLNNKLLKQGDGAAIGAEKYLTLVGQGSETNEVLIFDLA
jgi:redox-sensitive bicupin YhaK (pirin superfamily)